MKLRLWLLAMIAVAACGTVRANPPATPISIDWTSGSAPGLTVYQAGPRVYDVTVRNGGTAVNLTGYTPVMYWSTSNTAASVVTGSVAIVTATSGTFRATFSASDLNYTQGAYLYGVGLTSNNYTTARQGALRILYDPLAAGASAVTWSTNVNLSLYTFTGTIPVANVAGAVRSVAINSVTNTPNG